MAGAQGLLIIERILRDRESIWEQIGEERDLGRLTRDMLLSASGALACYGAVLGASNSDNPLLQAVVSAVKLPLLFLVTLAICLPTLYLFNLVFGARLQVRQALALVLVAITVIATLVLAFAPISLFFLITANQYSFYKLLNVGILTLAALVGLRFLTAGMAALNRHNAVRAAFAKAAAEAAEKSSEGTAQAPAATPPGAAPPSPDAPTESGAGAVSGSGSGSPADPPVPVPVGAPAPAPVTPGGAVVPARVVGNGVVVQPVPAAGKTGPRVNLPAPAKSAAPVPAREADGQASMTLLYVWIMLFGFVGTQLAWTLRPFFGSPGEKFQLFRSIDGNFYVDIVRTLGHLF
jgi:hypothetical protein